MKDKAGYMRRVIAIVLMGFAISSCSKEDASVKNNEVVRQMIDAFNRHDWEKMAGYYTEKADFLDPSFGITYVSKSRTETVEKYAGYQRMIPDIHDEIVDQYSSGDKVIIEFVSTGTISDSIQFRLPIISVLTLKDGMIVKDATYYDLN